MDIASNSEILAILNDFNNDEIFDLSLQSIKEHKRGIIMINGNNSQDVIMRKLKEAQKSGACAVGIDLSYYYNCSENKQASKQKISSKHTFDYLFEENNDTGL